MPTRMQLEIRAAGCLEAVADDLAWAMSRSPLPPHLSETVVVQSRGLARWLTLELTKRLGCAAQIAWPFPQHVAAGLLTAHGLADDEPSDPWARDDLTWRLMDALVAPDLPTQVARYLDDGDARKRHQLATRIADRFDAYQLHRPALIGAWRAGTNPFDHPHAAWQADLWRRIQPRIAVPDQTARLATLIAKLRAGDDTGLPPRLYWVLTGVLPQAFVELIEALSLLRPVTVWVMTPSPLEWGGIETRREQTRRVSANGDRHGDSGHPLLATLARQAREWFRWLGNRTTWTDRWSELEETRPVPATLLGQLQGDIAGLLDPASRPVAERLLITPDDRSLTLHGCHGERREIEVLKDQLLAAFAECDGLRPSDVVVLLPDSARYAPLVEAVFGSGAETLPFRIADRTAAEEDPAAVALTALVALAAGRLGVSEVLAFLRLPAVQAAMGCDDDEVDLIVRWCDETGVRWGADAAHRASIAPGVEAVIGTWRAALDRLLMGYAVGALDDRVTGIAPIAGAVSPDGEMLGRFVAWCERLLAIIAALRSERPPGEWATVLSQAVDELLADAAGDTDLLTVRVALGDFAALISRTGAQIPVPIAVVAAHLCQALSSERHASGFVSGAITVAALKPMRSIPARVVALVGMDAGAFPRRGDTQPFDLIAAQPQPGDRDPQGDDRQLFLEALLAARERVIITWTAHSPTAADDEDERQPSSCVLALLDAVDATGRAEDGPPVRKVITTRHRRQPFSAAYAQGDDGLFTFDARAVAIAEALAAERVPLPPFVAGAVATSDSDRPTSDETTVDAVDLDALERFWRNPAESWCRAALGFIPSREQCAEDDDEPFAVSALALTRVGDGALRSGATVLDRASDDGWLPPGALGGAYRERLRQDLTDFSATLPDGGAATWQRVAIDGPGWRLTGQVPIPLAGGQVVWRFAHLKPADRLRAGLAHLVWSASGAGGETRLITRDGVVSLPPIDDALRRLDVLVHGRRIGLVSPLPFFCATSRMAAERMAKSDEPDLIPARSQVQEFWSKEPGGECHDPAIALAWRGRDPLGAERDAWLEWSWYGWDALDPTLAIQLAASDDGAAS